DEKKFGASSIQFINGDYLSISDSNDWDICGNNSDSCTIDFWFYHTGFEDVECYVSQQEDKRNRWWLINRYGLGLVFRFKSNGKLMIDTDFGGSISNNKWHHMALIIKGNGSIKHIGVFLNGKQVTYASTSFIDRVEGDLCIGKIGDDGYAAFKGYIDEFRVINSNPFNASPNADKTDSITVPISEYTPTPGNLQLFYMDDEGNEYKVKLEKQ
ncbi:MAG: hypothetical protein KAI72_04280, partial [Candidatus Pacebacteria bacterium]|nr:hypothetical protein [Candidatus Paceibacterota bacterium]